MESVISRLVNHCKSYFKPHFQVFLALLTPRLNCYFQNQLFRAFTKERLDDSYVTSDDEEDFLRSSNLSRLRKRQRRAVSSSSSEMGNKSSRSSLCSGRSTPSTRSSRRAASSEEPELSSTQQFLQSLPRAASWVYQSHHVGCSSFSSPCFSMPNSFLYCRKTAPA